MTRPDPIVGIDLGTTNSSVAIRRGGVVEVIPNALGELLTPSVVALDERSGALVTGRTAKDIYALRPDLGAALFKRAMGTDRGYRIAGKEYSAVELSALVLKSLRRDAATALGAEVSRAVVTVPAYFDDAQRYATLKAGELAGLTVARILNEPTAAAIAHGLHRRETDGKILVFDLGGGTFDVCLMDRFEGTLEVMSVAGESMLGGEDFTRRLAALALDRAGTSFERAELEDPEAVVAVIRRAELAKRRLSAGDREVILVPRIPGLTAEETPVAITRADAERTFEPLLERLAGPCRLVFQQARLNREDVDEVILVGGATRMPSVRAFAREHLRKEPTAGVDPDLAVVHGAAIQAALYDTDEDVGDLVVTDVASHSLGIETTKRYGGGLVHGFFLPVIHRNNVIPTSRAEIVATLEPNQREILLRVFEGEARRVEDNRMIGELRVGDLPRGPVQEVEVRFTYDLNGILEVEATVLATGEKHARVFSRSSETLSEARIAAAAARLARLKEDPRDRPRIRDLIARAEALLREADADLRRNLEHALDDLEDALAERDPGRTRTAVARLEQICEWLDGGERW